MQEKPLQSKLWLDAADYEQRIATAEQKTEITAEEAVRLSQFAREGYCVIDLNLQANTLESFSHDLNRLWKTRPANALAAAHACEGGQVTTMADLPTDDETDLRRPGTRILDIHDHSAAARSLYLHPAIHRHINLILKQPCVATQSLFFEYGSAQALHRDPWFVVTKPACNLVACWIALEDIHENSGPLSYVPKSHRLPFLFDDKKNIILHAPHVTREHISNVYSHMEQSMANNGLKKVTFTAKRGQAFIWHAGLVHGGSPVVESSKTRHSFVVHFDALKMAKKRGSSFLSNGEKKVVFTKSKHEENGCVGFSSPVMGS